MLILRCALFGLLLLVGFSTQAGSLGYITKMEDIGNYWYNFWFTIVYIDSDDPTPNPCYGGSSCTYHFTVGMKGARGSYSIMSFPRNYRVNAVNAKTLGDVGVLFKSKISLPLSAMEPAAFPVNAVILSRERCFGLFREISSAIGGGILATPVPGSICGLAPPPTGACKLVGDIVLDHGTVNSDQVNGNQATTTANLECSQAMSIKVTATGVGSTDVVLRADGSLTSSLQVNGVAGKTGATVDVPANTKTPVKFTSVLKTKGTVAAGPFTGSGTAVLSIP
ncbi:putative MrfH protein [Serratia proteamaculans]|uniref:MrpH family fimbial adhesin n=1 Tax=Serratia proteamaculans TaxID=28151 RepID=UPI0009F7A7D0|nr:hypothetical protein [Serratia proteamaculans]SMB26910.1 putative MrfH protein [Serratia proteamaculans]